jgi:hypothetical protein
MSEPEPTAPELDKAPLLVDLWKEAVGKVFKLVSKSYGLRTVTYTYVKAVKEGLPLGEFDIEVLCAELSARVLTSKRAHSSMCKEGSIHQNARSVLTPGSFGDECDLGEFDKIAGAILAHATTNLDWAIQSDPEDKLEIEVPIDLPHLKLTSMEASLVRNSPFLIKDLYFLTANSVQAAFESINQDLHRASRNTRLADAVDPVYVSQKNEAVISLRKKLSSAPQETNLQKNRPQSADACDPLSLMQTAPAFQLRDSGPHSAGSSGPKKVAATGGGRTGLALVAMDSIALALLGRAAAASLSWERQNPSQEGAVFRLGEECGLLKFVRWAHVSGRAVPEQEAAGKKIRGFFAGPDNSYSGPDRDGIYPLLKPE